MMRKILLINSSSGVLQIFVGMLLVFFTIPVFLNKLGAELFGVYSILLLIGNVNSLANFGLISSLLKFVAEQGKSVESDHDIIVTFIILVCIISFLSLVAFSFREFIMADIFGIDQKFIVKDTIWLYNSLVISNFLMFIGQIGTVVLDAQQKIYLTNLYQVIYSILYWGLILLVLSIFSNLQYIGISIIISSLIWFLLVLYSFWKYWGKLQYSGIFYEFRTVFKKNFSYGMKLYISGILYFLFEPLSKILVSNFVGLKEVGLLDIVLRIRTQIWSVISKFFYPLLPYISQERDGSKLSAFITDLEQKMVFLFLPLIIIVIFVANPFIQLWIGRDVDLIANGIILLVPAHIAGLLLLPHYQFLTVKGYPGKTIVLQAVNAGVNILIFFLLLPYLDYYAIIFANFSAILISTFVNMYYQKKYLNSFIFSSLKDFIKWSAVFIVLCLTGIILSSLIENKIHLILFLLCAISLVSLLLFRILRVFNINDIHKYFGFSGSVSKFIERLIIIQ